MDAPLDLYRASREELLGIVLRQREQLAEQERRLAWQERELTQQRAVIAQLQERVGLATLFGTWRLQGLDPLAQCRALLAAPQL